MIKKYNKITEKYIKNIDLQVEEILLNYDWPGNIRELENTIEFMFNISENSETLQLSDVPDKLLPVERKVERKNFLDLDELKELDDFEEIEKKYIEKAFKIYGSDTEGKRIISKKMNIGLTTLYRKMQRYGL